MNQRSEERHVSEAEFKKKTDRVGICCARRNQIGSLGAWQRFWPEYQLPVVPFIKMRKV